MAVLANPNVSFTQRRKGEVREFRLIFALCFVVFLVAAVVARLLTPFGGHAAKPRRSVFEEARTAAQTSLPFAFMG